MLQYESSVQKFLQLKSLHSQKNDIFRGKINFLLAQLTFLKLDQFNFCLSLFRQTSNKNLIHSPDDVTSGICQSIAFSTPDNNPGTLLPKLQAKNQW